MSAPRLDPARVAAHLAEREAEIAGQKVLVERLYDLHDAEWRQLGDMEHRLAEMKRVLAERGELP